MHKFILALTLLLAACSDFEIVTDQNSTVGVVRHLNKAQVYDHDILVFETECWAKVYIDTNNDNVFIKLSDDLSMITWPEIHQYELAGHQYSFKKVRCD